MFAVSAGFEASSEFFGWSVEIYRVYLVLSASQVAIMGAGALYLILKKNVFSTKGLLAIDAMIIGVLSFFSWTMTLSSITDYSALMFGAMDYPILGMGIYAILIPIAILAGKNRSDQDKKMLHGHIYLVFAIIATIWMGAYAMTAEVFTENFVSGIAVAGNAMAQHVRNFSPFMSVTGGILLIGGAFFSFLKNKFRFNLWIAMGGLVLSVAGSIARGGSEFGNILYIGEVVGILLLYKGFVDSDKIIKSREEKMVASQS